MSIAKSDGDEPNGLRKIVRAKIEGIAAENEALKSQRNARRFKSERDPAEYEKQKEGQRAEYAAKIASEEGREVREYVKVPGKTRVEREANAKARDAERKRKSRANQDQASKDREADKRFMRRKKKAGWTEAEIQDALKIRLEARRLSQPDAGDYEEIPEFGAF